MTERANDRNARPPLISQWLECRDIYFRQLRRCARDFRFEKCHVRGIRHSSTCDKYVTGRHVMYTLWRLRCRNRRQETNAGLRWRHWLPGCLHPCRKKLEAVCRLLSGRVDWEMILYFVFSLSMLDLRQEGQQTVTPDWRGKWVSKMYANKAVHA